MSEEMAVCDNVSQELNILNSVVACEDEMEATVTDETLELPAELPTTESECIAESNKDEVIQGEMQELSKKEDGEIPKEKELEIKEGSTHGTETEQPKADDEYTRGIKRRASAAFSDEGDEDFKGFDNSVNYEFPEYERIVEEERRVKCRISTSNDDGFKGFNLIECNNLTGYCQVLERLEAEVSAAVKSYTPLRSVMAAPAIRANKRARQDTGGCTKWSEHLEAEVSAFVRSFSDEDVKPAKRPHQPTDGSRPSSALSTRSDGDGAISTDASSSPAGRGRRSTVEMSSPLLRVPLDRGWKRELVYRASGATSDSHNRRNADIYYYTPLGKKLRSTREVSEQLHGTGLTLENFSFFKEPLGVDDPEKEIIRGPPTYYGHPPHPSAGPGGFAYVPAPVMMPMYPPHEAPSTQPTYVTNYIYPPQPAPEPVQVVENINVVPEMIIDWVPATTADAHTLYGRAYVSGREGWDGSPLWSIRAHHNGNLVPGKLAIKHKAAYIPFAGKEIPVHNFEVLCAPTFAVNWVRSSNGQVPPGALIAGNTHTAEPLYLGRVTHRGSLAPGKVHPSHECCYISFSGSEVSYKQYEVLCRADGH